MSGVRRDRSARLRDDSAQRRRSAPLEKMEKEQVTVESPSSSGPGNSNIRTRLSTGTLHMNGTQTFKDIKLLQTSDDSNDSQKVSTPVKASPVIPSLITGKRSGSDSSPLPPKRRKIGKNDGSGESNKNDYFCWVCHKEGNVICCELCPRVFHKKCLEMGTGVPNDWVCPECEKIMRAECIDSRSRAMAMISVDTLCFLLKFALDRMKHQGSDPFLKAVDPHSVPHYCDYIFHPMDLAILEKNIKKKMYGCTEAFLADAKWILHNCVIFNGLHNKLTTAAKTIIKICRHEMSEIEVCPDCYLNSCVKKNDEWFCEPCREPHPLVWAKLKGYPFWSAKALREKDGLVDVRFFGAHDRSWVPPSQVFMLSEDIPVPMRNKRTAGFDNAMEETNLHIKKLRDKFGDFEYAPFRTPYDKSKVYSPMKKKVLVKKPAHHFNVVKRKTIDPKSSATKTASALRLKYNSIITTRKAAVVKSPSASSVKSDSSFSPELVPFNDPALKADDPKSQEKCDSAESDLKVENKVVKDDSKSKPTAVVMDTKVVGEGPQADSLLEKESWSDDDSVNLLEDRVLDSSESETMSPVKTFKKTLENKVSKDVSDKLSEKLQQKVKDDMSQKAQTEPSVRTESVKSDSVPMETDDTVVTESKVTETESDKKTSEEPESSVKESESSKVNLTSADDRQTPTDSVDSDVVCRAKGGKVNECDKEKDSAQNKQDVNLAKDIESDERLSDEPKCSERQKERTNEKTHDSDSEPRLVMDLESESEVETIFRQKSPIPVRLVLPPVKSPPKDILRSKLSSDKRPPLRQTVKPPVTALKNIAPKPAVALFIPAPVPPPAPPILQEPLGIISMDTTDTQKPSMELGPKQSAELGPKVAPMPATDLGPKVAPELAIELAPSLTQKLAIVSAQIPLTEPGPQPPTEAAPKPTTVSPEPMKVAMFRSKHNSGESSEKSPQSMEDIDDQSEEEPEITRQASTQRTEASHDSANLVVEKYKSKLMDAMKNTLDDMCTDLLKNVVPDGGSNKHYQQELEKLRWIHLQEVAELKHNFKLTVMEMRTVWDAEKQRLFKDISKMCEKEKNKAIAEAKKKQWCAQCGKEAIYYCCWNTSYCTYECQQSHWPEHMPSCMQTLSANQDPEKVSQSKASSSGSKEERGKKGPSPASKSSDWTEKDEAEQAQRTFNLAPPVSTSPPSSTNTVPPGSWRNRARDNLEQVLRRQEETTAPPPPPTQTPQTVFIPPQLLHGQQQPQASGQPFMQGGQPLAIQYIQQVPQNSGPSPATAVHLPPNFTQPPQVRLGGYPVSQGNIYPVLRQHQQPPHIANPSMTNQAPVPANFMPRSQIFLAPNAQPPRNMPNTMQYQIRPCP